MSNGDIVGQLKQSLVEKAGEIKKILTTLNMLKEYDNGIEIPDLKSLLNIDGKELGLKGDASSIRPDEFYQMTNTEAAEKYLKKVGHAVSLDEIFEAIQKGGIKFSSNGKISLNVQLTRATSKFCKMKHGDAVNFGLREWYPKKRKIATQEAEEEVLDE